MQGGFAERKRFELSIQLPIYYLSRVAPSTTRTPLCVVNQGANIGFLIIITNITLTDFYLWDACCQILISPQSGMASKAAHLAGSFSFANTYIIFVIAASAVISEPLITPTCCRNLLV
jgi:hypothetical protein